MAFSAQGPHSQRKFGNYVDREHYVGKEAHNAGQWGGYWSADYGQNDWIGIDLGVGCAAGVCRLVINQEVDWNRPHGVTCGSDHFVVQSSINGADWNTEHECWSVRATHGQDEEYSW